MTIHFDSWESFVGAILGLITVVSTLSIAHWKLFAEPRLKNILCPYGERLEVVSRVVRLRFPQEYTDAMGEMKDERSLRGAI